MHDLMTSRDFPDFEMLDAKMASALKRIISDKYFQIRVSVEEQTGQKYDRFLRGRKLAYMIYDRFRATGARDAALDQSDLDNVSLPGDDFQDFDTRWDKVLLSASEKNKRKCPKEVCTS